MRNLLQVLDGATLSQIEYFHIGVGIVAFGGVLMDFLTMGLKEFTRIIYRAR